jgi:uncharacterized coiled-coil protein SlyX
MERFDARMERLETRIFAKLDSIETRLEMLTGSIRNLDKRLSLLADRVLNRPQ